jgi:hypothetical protein
MITGRGRDESRCDAWSIRCQSQHGVDRAAHLVRGRRLLYFELEPDVSAEIIAQPFGTAQLGPKNAPFDSARSGANVVLGFEGQDRSGPLARRRSAS